MNQCDICEEMGCRDCENCSLGNPCYDCEDYDRITKNCTSNGGCAADMRKSRMKNADKFKSVFGLYATEVWSMPEKGFLRWLNSECTETEQRWIPLKEREPKEEGEYLVSFDDGFIATTGYYDNDFELWADAGEPLAWMPLPEPYREE